ncbi:MAG: hypothetical protein PHG15_03585 [Acinetobacter sp.]|uniref:phage tail tube protein n=1 Tax=Acinetobacter sp. TaxID=472 RepID=UPI0026349A52|nr:hypothetical protein [Acinetobacter sp.]MDD2944893.1 hypothetical protein [Acinetobacter sp.]
MSITKKDVKSEAFIGRGEVHLTPVIGGVEQETFWVGVASEQKMEHEVSDKKELYEYHEREQVLWDSSKGKTKTSMSLKIDERRKEAMKAALRASTIEVPENTVVDEEYSPIGKSFFLKARKVSDLSITDSAALPLAAGVDYEVDEVYGQIKILKETVTLPLKISYASGKTEKMLPATESVDHYIVRTKGFNTVGDEGDHLVTVPRFKMDIASALDLISEDFTSVTVTGECLFDPVTKAPYEIEKIS